MSLDTAARMQDVPSGKSIAAAPRPLFGQTLDGRVVLHDIEHLVTGFGPNPECLDWQLDDIAAHLGFARGPAQGWDWTTAATTG
jgi:hypothetical protein